MSISEHDETGENVKRHPDTEPRITVPKEMLNGTIATRIELIRRSMIFLCNDIKTKEDSNEAWNVLQKAFSYLSAKDTMIKYCEEHKHVV
jgi:hypothetical protein